MSKLRIDIVSDVVCPWCVIGYKRLEAAMQMHPDVEFDLHWHPFELNPAMPHTGQNLREHLQEKYQTTDEASQMARQSLMETGKQLGFDFNFFDDMKIYNTRKAHQLVMWQPMKVANWNLPWPCLMPTSLKG